MTPTSETDIGYARVSTSEQTAASQEDALAAAGCYKVWSDVASGATTSRPQFDALMDTLRPGDTLVVWRLDRLGRSLPHLLETVDALQHRKVGFRSLTESIDTTTSGGKLIFSIFGALAEFERNLIRERTAVGLQAARARGRTGGRPVKLTPAKLKQATRMRSEGADLAEIASVLDVSRTTLYRHLSDRRKNTIASPSADSHEHG